MPRPKGIMTNKKFSKEDELFKTACEIANVEPTKRQASKFRNQKGLAWECRQAAQRKLEAKNEQRS